MDGEAWHAAAYGSTKSWTRLSNRPEMNWGRRFFHLKQKIKQKVFETRDCQEGSGRKEWGERNTSLNLRLFFQEPGLVSVLREHFTLDSSKLLFSEPKIKWARTTRAVLLKNPGKRRGHMYTLWLIQCSCRAETNNTTPVAIILQLKINYKKKNRIKNSTTL